MLKAKVNLIISGLILDEKIKDVIDLNGITSRSENNLDKWRSVGRNMNEKKYPLLHSTSTLDMLYRGICSRHNIVINSDDFDKLLESIESVDMKEVPYLSCIAGELINI